MACATGGRQVSQRVDHCFAEGIRDADDRRERRVCLSSGEEAGKNRGVVAGFFGKCGQSHRLPLALQCESQKKIAGLEVLSESCGLCLTCRGKYLREGRSFALEAFAHGA